MAQLFELLVLICELLLSSEGCLDVAMKRREKAVGTGREQQRARRLGCIFLPLLASCYLSIY